MGTVGRHRTVDRGSITDYDDRCDLEKLVLWNYYKFGGNPEQNTSLPNRGIATAGIYAVGSMPTPPITAFMKASEISNGRKRRTFVLPPSFPGRELENPIYPSID